jgi:hypothetical protein
MERGKHAVFIEFIHNIFTISPMDVMVKSEVVKEKTTTTE